MPRTINYLERYEALLGMDDRSAVLQRIESTLDLADDIVNAAHGVDVQVAVEEAAEEYVRLVMGLDGVAVSEPDKGYVEPSGPNLRGSRDMGVASAIEAAFSASMGELTESERSYSDEAESARTYEYIVDERISRSIESAVKASTIARRREAESVARERLRICELRAFDGRITLQMLSDVEKLRALSAEVRRSFLTFKQVIGDNGLFAAFSGETSYGACKGVSLGYWWDDDSPYFEFWGDSPKERAREAIPTSIEEDQGGDTLERSIEKMAGFNKQRYWGMLDDDFQQHVDAFWYGFGQLMSNVNCLFTVDMRGFGSYCRSLAESVADDAGCLGERMDDVQVREFCDEVNRRSTNLQEA